MSELANETDISLDSSDIPFLHSQAEKSSLFTAFVTLERKTAADEERLKVVTEMRGNIINLPRDRHEEIFADFAGALESGDLEYLADTVMNWATGGHGYKYVGMPLKSVSIGSFGKYKDDPDMEAL